jgi:RNA polymerase sigma-70 factor (ECF subfamily)
MFIDRATTGDELARSALIDHACERLLKLTRKMFHQNYAKLRRWEQTDDVFQNAMLRLHTALGEVRVESVRHFFNLAGVMIRRTLLDLAKHHFGPLGAAANHHTDSIPADEPGGTVHRTSDPAAEPTDLDGWSDFHAQVEKLPDEEREVVNLLYYESLPQEEAARVLGVSLRTVKRRWQSARCRLHAALNSEGAP